MSQTTNKKKSKKEFVLFLNSKYGYQAEKRGSLKGASKRLYGDWLYSADKEYFNLAYDHWTKTGTDEGW